MNKHERKVQEIRRRRGEFYDMIRAELNDRAIEAERRDLTSDRAYARRLHRQQLKNANREIAGKFGNDISGRQKRKLRRKLMRRPSV